MKTMAFFCALSVSLIANTAQAFDVEGITISDSVTLIGSRARLTLNGAGLHTKFLTKLYVAALYLPQLANNADAVLKQNGPNRMTLFVVKDQITREEFAEELQKGFSKNQTEQEFNALKPQLAQFTNLLPTVVKGDVVIFEYTPQSGTRVYINGDLKGTMPGKGFHRSLLKCWLGKDAIDDSLKASLLGAE
jgi:hypothetical protein